MTNKTKTERQKAELEMSMIAGRHKIVYVIIEDEQVEEAMEQYGKKITLNAQEMADLKSNASCNLHERIVEAVQDELEGGMYD
jgi:hypothetical protein